jgi:aryl-alcohol dehydrogenase-like predicted oxidoreductase
MNEIDASLRRLGKDYYQIHRWDYETPIEETLETLHDLFKAGKVRYIGASSMYAWQLCKALYIADRYSCTRFAAMQNHYNLIQREDEREMLPLCHAEGVGVVPWSPLARGLLTRDPEAPTSDKRAHLDTHANAFYGATKVNDQSIIKRVREIAAARGVSRTQIALSWLPHKSTVTAPIVGAMEPQHIDDAAAAAVHIELAPDEIRTLEEAYAPNPVVFGEG